MATEEKKSNPQVDLSEDASHSQETDYKQMERLVREQAEVQHQQEYIPDNPIDTAHLLIENSKTSDAMSEIDKEIKLANLDAQEKYAVYQFTSVWNDMMFMRGQQDRKLIEAAIVHKDHFDIDAMESLMEGVESMYKELRESQGEVAEPLTFDGAGTFKKARFVAVLSRGKYGFERIQQVRTISEYKMENIDKTEKKPNFMQKMGFGGFRR